VDEDDKKAILSVRIKESTKERFEELCQVSGLRKAEVIETLIEWFMNPKETV
jgi:antitoxin component of RelBE/YafQ-DinJ toxin-antitoxin module